MKRKLLILGLCLAMMLSSVSLAFASAFSDTGNGELAMAAAVLQGLGVVAGNGSGEFQPDGTLTRAQACTMFVNMMGLDSKLSTGAKKTYFTDVPSGSWYAAYVNLAYSNSLINGYGNGKFGPNDKISYGQFATIVLRMLGYSSSDVGSVWPSDYTALCEDLGISDDFTISDNASLTRGQAALMLYRSLSCKTKDDRQSFYETISDVASTKEVLVLSVDAEENGSTGLLLGYSLGQPAEEVYIVQATPQSEIIEGCSGTLLLNTSGRVVGFLPSDDEYEDLVIEAAGISYLTAGGSKYRMSSSVLVLDQGGATAWTSGGYLKAAALKGESARFYFDSDGTVQYVYLFTSDDTADTASLQYQVSGYISSISPSPISAESVTVAGSSFEISEAAAGSFSSYKIGEKVTLHLNGELEVCSVDQSSVSDTMVGVLASDGKSVTLCGSGVRISGETIKYKDKLAGGLVQVKETSKGTLYCQAVAEQEVSGDLSIEERTVGTTALAPDCAIYEWTGSGYLCSLEGVRGEASTDFDEITWTDTIAEAQISWYHVGSDGLIDILLLNDVTGSCYTYGYLEIYEDSEGIDLGSNVLHAYNDAGVLVNSSGNGQKSLCVITDGEDYFGVAYGRNNSTNTIVSVKELESFTVSSLDSFSVAENKNGTDAWFVMDGTVSYEISDEIQVYSELSEQWSADISDALGYLESGYTLTAYFDRSPETGGQVRILVIND